MKGRISGFITGLGAATADAFYGLIAGLGLVVISTFLINHQEFLRLIGGIFLCYLGLNNFFKKPYIQLEQPDDKLFPRQDAIEENNPSRIRSTKVFPFIRDNNLILDYLSTFLLTLTNPLTILSFTAVFAGLGFPISTGTTYQTFFLVFGVFSGSAFWWLLLSSLMSIFRTRLKTPNAFRWINRISGVIILSFGIIALFPILKTILEFLNENIGWEIIKLKKISLLVQ